jgi:adenosylcobinamide-GDP ribazoletransferase
MKALHVALCAFGFLTVLPAGKARLEPNQQGWMAAVFPLVGAAIGALLIGAAQLPVQRDGAALAVLLAWVLLTGGLHLDGVADLADGLGAAHVARERRLAIMKDSRVGAHGALAMAIIVLSKWVAIRGVLGGGAAALVAVPILARTVLAVFIRLVPSARADGLGHSLEQKVAWVHVIVAASLGAALFIAIDGRILSLSLLGMFAVSVAIGLVAIRTLGGATGDVYGVVVEACEVAGLMIWGAHC